MDGGEIIAENQKVVVSFSGGMDSSSLILRYLADGCHVVAVSFLYGQKHSIEIEYAKKNIALLQKNGCNIHHEIADLSSAMHLFSSALLSDDTLVPEGHYEEEQMKATVVPNRNAIFSSLIYGKALSIAIQHDEEVKIGLGVHSGDHAIYPDCRPEFYDAIHNAFTLGNWESEKVSFDLPYLHGEKSTILKDALASCDTLGLNFDEVFSNTLTSYNPDSMGRSSGKSGSDIERILAF
jgi:7-cyano-7-deazaguanine synthase